MEISKVSLDIANYWKKNQYLTESNKNAGVIVAFDWLNDKLIEINTNIDLGDFEVKYFEFETFKNFISLSLQLSTRVTRKVTVVVLIYTMM